MMKQIQIVSLISLMLLIAIQNGSTASISKKNYNISANENILDSNASFTMFNFMNESIFITYNLTKNDEVVDEGFGVLFKGKISQEWNMCKIYRSVDNDQSYNLEVKGYDIKTRKELFSENLYLDFKLSEMVTIPKKLLLDQQLTITIDGFFNQSAEYQITFFDGTNQYKRNGSLPQGRTTQVNVTKVLSYDSSKFVLDVNVISANDELSWIQNDFEIVNQDYDFKITRNLKSGSDVVFEFSSYINRSVFIEYSFISLDDKITLVDTFVLEADEVKSFKIFQIPYNYTGSTNFTFQLKGYDLESISMKLMFMETVKDFTFDQLDYKIEVSNAEKSDQIMMYNNMNNTMKFVSFFFSDNFKAYGMEERFLLPGEQQNFAVTTIPKRYESSESFQLSVAGYSNDTNQLIFSKTFENFSVYQTDYDIKISKEIEPGKMINLSVRNNNTNISFTTFKFSLYLDDNLVSNDSFSLFPGAISESSIFEVPENFDLLSRFTFIISGFHSTTGKEIFNEVVTNFEYQKPKLDFSISKAIYPGESISFEAVSNIAIFANYTFTSNDGRLSFSGKLLMSPGDRVEKFIGELPRLYSGSKIFTFIFDGYDYVANKKVFSEYHNDFNFFDAESTKCEISRIIYPNKEISFTIENLIKDESLLLNYTFISDDNSLSFRRSNLSIDAGSTKTIEIGKILRSYKGSRNFRLEYDIYNSNSKEFISTKIKNGIFLEMGTYSIFIPKIIRPGFDITFSVSTTRGSVMMILLYDFYSEDFEFSMMGDAVINQDETRFFVIGQVPRDYTGSTNFHFNITAFDDLSSDVVFYNETSDFVYDKKSVSILIETDQSVYHPQQTIKFRALCLSPDLLPVTGDVQYSFIDPQGNSFNKLSTKAFLTYGVISDEMPLHKYSQEGEWTIQVRYEGYSEELKVNVTSEKADKFSVDVFAAEYFYNKMKGFNLKINARYPSGEAVRGRARLMAEIRSSNRRLNQKMFKPKIFRQTFENFNGDQQFFLSKQTIKSLGWKSWTDVTLLLSVSVTEQGSDVTYSDETTVQLKRSNIKLDVVYRSDVVKRGMKYSAFIKVSEQDGKPLMEEDRRMNDLIVDVEYRYPVQGFFKALISNPNWAKLLVYTPPKTQRYVLKIPLNGEIDFTMVVDDSEFEYVSFRCFTNTTAQLYGLSETSQWVATPFKSPSNSYVQVTTDNQRYQLGDRINVDVNFSENVKYFRVMLMSRGMIVSDKSYSYEKAEKSFQLKIDTNYHMSPILRIVVSNVREDGEIVADYTQIILVENLINKVDMETFQNNFGFDEKSSIKIETEFPISFIGISASNEDQSSYNKITKQRVVEDLKKYSPTDQDLDNEKWWTWTRSMASNAASTRSVFDQSNLNVLTDETVFASKQDRIKYRRPKTKKLEKTQKFSSTNFPNSWIWNQTKTDQKINFFNQTTPNLTGLYSINAFVLSNNGLSLSEDKQIKIFEYFYLNLDLPYTAIRGEIVVVKATIHNYYKEDLPVNLYLAQSDQYEPVVLGDVTYSGPVRWVTASSGKTVIATFPINMTRLGDVTIRLVTRSNKGSRTFARNIFVEPEGLRYCYSTSKIFTNNWNSSSSDTNFTIRFPDNTVEGSRHARVFLSGHLMTNTIEHMEKLLDLPRLEATMNMMDFVTATMVQRLSQADEQMSERAVKLMEVSFLNQKNFRNFDGSYSFFGSNKRAGSSWLTALVCRSFAINNLGEDLMKSGFDYLMSQQDSNGSFKELSDVVHPSMENTPNNKTRLTSLVVIAMSESKIGMKIKERLNRPLESALEYLESQIEQIKDDQYSLSLVTYAFATASKAKLAEKTLNYFEQFAQFDNKSENEGRDLDDEDEELMFWSVDDQQNSQFRNKSIYPVANSRSVEMSSYALMIYTQMNLKEKARRVMNWLIKHRNSNGGFSEPYSTALGIQALSMYIEYIGMNMYQYYDPMKVEMSHSKDAQYKTQQFFYQNNIFKLFEYELPNKNGELLIKTSGEGRVVAQINVCYNLNKSIYKEQTFNCSKQISKVDMRNVNVEYCCRLRSEEDKSGLFLFQLQPFSGFVISPEEQARKNRMALAIDFDNGLFNIYFSQLYYEKNTCMKVVVERNEKIADNKPAYIIAQNYFSPEQKNIDFYRAEGFEDLGACSVCGMDCFGCPGARLSEWMEKTPCLSCEQKFSTWHRVCIDPSLNVPVQARFCLEQEVEEKRRCGNSSAFPICPDSHDGLWKVLPTYMDHDSRDQTQLCKLRPSYFAPYFSSNWETASKQGIPGSDLQLPNAYMECKLDSRPAYEGNFSLSLLVYIESFQMHEEGVIFAYGDEGKPAIFKFWHHSMFGQPMIFRMSFNNFIYTIGPVDGRKLLRKWTHVMITWNVNETLLYINGTSTGFSFHFPTSRKQEEPENPILFLGRDTERKYKKTLNGWVSSLDFWSRTLSEKEAAGVYKFYEPALIESRDQKEDAELPFNVLRHISPSDYKKCFNKTSSLKTLFHRQLCEEEY